MCGEEQDVGTLHAPCHGESQNECQREVNGNYKKVRQCQNVLDLINEQLVAMTPCRAGVIG